MASVSSGRARIRWIITGTTASTWARCSCTARKRVLGIEAPAQDHGRGQRQAEDEVGEAPGVEQRRGDHHPLAAAIGDAVEEAGDRAETAGAGPLGSLRGPGRARGEDDEAGLLLGRVEVRLVAGGDHPLERRSRSPRPRGPGDHPLDPLDALQQAAELLVVDQQPRALARDHVGELGAGEHRVQIERAGAELGRGDRRVDEAAVVSAHDPDPVASPDAEPGERVGERVGAAVQLLEGERAAIVDQRRLVAGG